jgi:predicted GNAT family acetyltransferase
MDEVSNDACERGHPLDRVIWNALAGEQSRFAIGDDRVRRYGPSIAPFAAMVDTTPASLDALHKLIALHGPVAFSTTGVLPILPGLHVVRHAMLVQMIWQGDLGSAFARGYLTLSGDDVPDMISLATATEPGPFGPRTIELGKYLGVRVQGRLAAMAGERMKVSGYTEISAVCVDPAFRGQGHATGLIRSLIAGIRMRNEIPFLHVLKSNSAAIALYRHMGFVERRDMHLTIVDR